MLIESIVYSLVFCDICKEPVIYKSEAGLPQACPFCGGLSSVETNSSTRMSLLLKKQESGRGTQTKSNVQRFAIINGQKVAF